MLEELEERGLGWLRPEGVRRKLVEVGAGWRGLPAPQPLAETGSTAVRMAVSAVPGGLPRWLTWGGAGLAALLLLGAVGVWRSVTGLGLDLQQVEQVRLGVSIAQLVHRQPAGISCDRALLSSYVLAYGQPYTVDPETAETAAACLEKLADPASVALLLDQLRIAPEDEESDEAADGEVSWRGRRVAALLARLGDGVVGEVSRGVSDPTADVSGTAALALAVRGSERSVSALAGCAFDPDPQVRRSVARVLPELVASQVLPVERAFALVERLAGDHAPATRRYAAEALRLFGGRAAHRLAERLARDPDPGVRAAADRRPQASMRAVPDQVRRGATSMRMAVTATKRPERGPGAGRQEWTAGLQARKQPSYLHPPCGAGAPRSVRRSGVAELAPAKGVQVAAEDALLVGQAEPGELLGDAALAGAAGGVVGVQQRVGLLRREPNPRLDHRQVGVGRARALALQAADEAGVDGLVDPGRPVARCPRWRGSGSARRGAAPGRCAIAPVGQAASQIPHDAHASRSRGGSKGGVMGSRASVR